MTYKHNNRYRPDEVCSNCQRHKNAQEQRLKERFKSNFQIRNKTRLFDSKTKNDNMKCAKQT